MLQVSLHYTHNPGPQQDVLVEGGGAGDEQGPGEWHTNIKRLDGGGLQSLVPAIEDPVSDSPCFQAVDILTKSQELHQIINISTH